jgi:hypothetical protein
MSFNNPGRLSAMVAVLILGNSRLVQQIECAMRNAHETGLGVLRVSIEGDTIMTESINEDIRGASPDIVLLDGYDTVFKTRGTINHKSTRSGLDSLATALAASCCVPEPIIWADSPPIGDWQVPRKTVIKQAKQQSFKARMRSVNRNR